MYRTGRTHVLQMACRNDMRNIYSITVCELDTHVFEFFISIVKSDGNDNEPGSLNAMKSSINRYLKDNEYQYTLRDK